MNTAPIKDFVCSHMLVIVGLCFATLILADWNGIAFGTGGKIPIVDPYDRTGTDEDSPAMRRIQQSKQPNVLLIGIETLRADHVGCLGYDRETTPTLDRLAHEGILCTRTLSTSGWTLPSVMSVMTSLYPDVHRIYTYEHRLSEEIMTLADVLKANGYTTIGLVSNPVLDGRYGFSDGFDLYDDFTVSLDSSLDIFKRHDATGGVQYLASTGELVTRTAAKWLEQCLDGPFFMFVFYIDPHYDYIPPAPFDTMFDPNYEGDMDGRGVHREPRRSQRPSDRDLQHLLSLYDGEIRYTDGCIAELLRVFAKSGALKNTVVVLFGDHGDEFYEHGKTAHDRTLYDEIIHVPLVFLGPGRFPSGKRISAVTSQIDIMPTILDYLGVTHEGPMQGASLRPLIEGKAERLHETVWAELNTWIHVQAVVSNHHKLIRNVSNDSWELYNLLRDPDERINLYAQPSTTGVQLTLMAKWEQWIRDNSALAGDLSNRGRVEKVQLNEQELQKLRALGYAQ
ncbi:MAG: sulfatase-like hydrolase/transferase [Planctomycetes bacterium]|nr:sulfatase-like hydrolase/transferase [Planctomycetota bacterium]